MIAVIDPDTEKIKWSMTGPFIRQHDPDFMDNGYISVFDNKGGTRNEKTLQASRILSINPANKTYNVLYDGSDDEPFVTLHQGNHQHLPNGNILITESTEGRIFEVNPNRDIVWSFINRWDEDEVILTYQATRYPESFGEINQMPCENHRVNAKLTLSQVIQEHSKSGKIILMSVKGEAISKLSKTFKKLMNTKGSQIKKLKHRGSYIGIIRNGDLEEELIMNDAKAMLSKKIGKHNIFMSSAGNKVGNQSIIKVNGVSLSSNQRGINVVVLDTGSDKALIYHYDTHANEYELKTARTINFSDQN